MMGDAMYTTAPHGDDDRNEYAISSIQIENYRIFEQFAIPRLGRVNLIAGKNNVGKSCLLEALQVYASRGAPSVLIDILQERDELPAQQSMNLKEITDGVRNLFHGRKKIAEETLPIRMTGTGEAGAVFELSVGYPYDDSRTLDQGARQHRIAETSVLAANSVSATLIPALMRRQDSVLLQVIRLESFAQYADPFLESTLPASTPCVALAARGLTAEKITKLWDEIALTRVESEIIRALRIIAPDVEAVNIVGRGERPSQVVAKVRRKQDPEPIPLRSLGEGMNRLFGLSLALVNARNGLLLIDEIESGLHYSVQLEVWRLILQMAQSLNVQVFASTHSWDCISAFQQALNDDPASDGVLIRLERRNDAHYPVIFDKDELAIADEQAIEIR